jgi:hypothetical protein
MCGELDEEGALEGDLYRRFLAHSRAMLEQRPGGGEMNAYLDGLFNAVLKRCVADAENAQSPNAYKQLAMQSLVMARLAGFLAGHVALNEDPMRKVLEAVMLGYQEAENPPERDHHGPGHDHDHDHDHGHGHHHHHDDHHHDAHRDDHSHGHEHGHAAHTHR